MLVLDMGEPVRIVDLARDLICLSGHTIEEISVVFSDPRPGERLFEELLADADADADATLATAVPRFASRVSGKKASGPCVCT